MFQVIWHKKAAKERLEILKYWIVHNGSDHYSRKLNEEIIRIQKLLTVNPDLGVHSEIENIRYVLILRNFSLYYQFKNNEIQILSFWDNRRNPEDLILSRSE